MTIFRTAHRFSLKIGIITNSMLGLPLTISPFQAPHDYEKLWHFGAKKYDKLGQNLKTNDILWHKVT